MTAPAPKVDAYARAILAIARAENMVAPVEDDLFRFARALEGSESLRVALTDPQLPLERRLAVIDDLTSGKALALSSALLGMLIGAGQVNDLGAVVDRFVELAAAEREREVAEVRSAIALDDAQVARLADALGRATGKAVEVKVIIDPSVLGGLVARIGDTVIDGSVRHRLDQMKAQL
ncbi:MAG: ATP synthase F1 subunit delta [Actinomycetota bacterium]